MQLNDAGNIAKKCWKEIPYHYPFVVLDAFVIMPNHIHGILIFENDPVRANNYSPCSRIAPVFESVPVIGFRANENGNGANAIGYRANDNSPLQEERKPAGTSGTVGAVVRGFKIGVTKWCRAHARANVPWHRNYYERIIRNDDEWNAIREYIEKNPEMWEADEMNLPEDHYRLKNPPISGFGKPE